MLIELAHYTFLFALTVVGLQTVLLCPTLWSGGSAVAIKLGFRGTCFTTALLLFVFLILLHAFAVHDFSLAVVFENSDSSTGLFYVLQAFCASREGYLFTFTLLSAVIFLAFFSKKELATYQERGRYLFACGCLILFMQILILSTANPFIRISEPPFEGVGFPSDWRPPYKILSVLFSLTACGFLTASFIRTICIYSKGRQFVLPALRGSLSAMILLTGAAGIELMSGFTGTADGKLWQWTPANTLLLSVLMLTAGQIILLYFCAYSRVFINWIVALSFFGLIFSFAGVLSTEYRLFVSDNPEVYFPNPVTALCALTGIICFLLFLCSVALKNHFTENGFPLFSRESFIGLSVASLSAAAISIGFLSLLPSLFMFMPDLPLRLLPALIKKTLLTGVWLFSLFFFAAFKQKAADGNDAREKKTKQIICGIFASAIACLCVYILPHGGKIVLFSVPAILIAASAVKPDDISIPASFRDALTSLKSFSVFKDGVLFCVAGFLIFSVAFSASIFNRTETATAVNPEKNDGLPCPVERLSEQSEASAARYRMICADKLHPLTKDLLFQWDEKPLKAVFLKTGLFSVDLIRTEQKRENTINVRTIHYSALYPAGSGIFLICVGLAFLLRAVRKENFS